jgi:hypothetical protein
VDNHLVEKLEGLPKLASSFLVLRLQPAEHIEREDGEQAQHHRDVIGGEARRNADRASRP